MQEIDLAYTIAYIAYVYRFSKNPYAVVGNQGSKRFRGELDPTKSADSFRDFQGRYIEVEKSGSSGRVKIDGHSFDLAFSGDELKRARGSGYEFVHFSLASSSVSFKSNNNQYEFRIS
jgi:hypothetical protein